MKSQENVSGGVVRLCVVDHHVAKFSGEVFLVLNRVLRYLRGRRKVWDASINCRESVACIAKQFLSGNGYEQEYRSEYKGLLELKNRGIACPDLLFTAQDNDGTRWVVTERISGARELSDIVLQAGGSGELNRATLAFAETLLGHWCIGVEQTDAHLRNFLWDGATLYTIDVGSIRFHEGELSVGRKTRILQKMLGGYIPDYRKQLLSAFFTACEQRGELELLQRLQSDAFLAGVVHEEGKDLKRVWRKSRRDCSQFRKICGSGKTILCRRDLDTELLELIKKTPDQLMSSGERLKSGNTCTVQKIDWAGQALVVKRYNPKPLFYRVRHILHMSRAMLSWSNGIVMEQVGVATTEPLAVVEERQWGLLRRAYFLMEHFEAVPIDRYLMDHEADPERFEFALKKLKALFLRLKDLRIVHGDLKAKNLLIDDLELRLIDTDGLRFLVNPKRFKRNFRSDFARFLSNWPEDSAIRHRLKDRLSPIFDN
jgi:tRNA A-37 threonylcarbamoyl transferase component Bud32